MKRTSMRCGTARSRRCVIQDLGYYPFGNHFFSNLLHYVRTGDFIVALIRDAQDVNDYALGHYAADNSGHPQAVNRAVPLMYPKLKAKFGNSVTYAQSPKNHVLVEFSFDVVQVAAAGATMAASSDFPCDRGRDDRMHQCGRTSDQLIDGLNAAGLRRSDAFGRRKT